MKFQKLMIMLDPEYFDEGVSALQDHVQQNYQSGVSVVDKRAGLCSMKWDDDPRELVDIPEATDLFCRTVLKAAEKSDINKVFQSLDDTTCHLLLAFFMRVTKRH